jgi:hypothetical protein
VLLDIKEGFAEGKALDICKPILVLTQKYLALPMIIQNSQ